MSCARRFGILAILALTAPPAAATVVEVPLPTLSGEYWPAGQPAYGGKSAVVLLPALPTVIHSVSVRVRGTNTFGKWSCDGSQGYHEVSMPTQTDVDMPATAGTWALGSAPNSLAPGAFEWTKVFEPFFGATWSFLLDGTGTIEVWCNGEPAILECYQTGVGATLSLGEVTLLVDGEFPTPATLSTWGRIKSNYR